MADLAGFDACYALGSGGLGQALQSQIQPLAVTSLRGITLPLPDTPLATLDVERVTVAPAAVIDGAQQRVTVTVTGTGDLRMGVNGQGLVNLPVVGQLSAALANVPISLSGIAVSCTLPLTIARASGVSQVTIDSVPGAATVTTTGFPPSTLAADLAAQITTRLNALLTGTTATVQAPRVQATANALATAIQPAIVDLVKRRLEGMFPLPINFAIPPVNAGAFCGIGLRTVEVRLLDGQPAAGGRPATASCLAIATTLLASSTPNVGALRSPLPSGEAAGLFFDNFFLISTVCCALRNAPQFRGLTAPSGPNRSDANPCCRWSGINVSTTLDGRLFNLNAASVCIDSSDPANKSFVIHMEMTTSDVGWDADVVVDAPITLGIENGAVVPVIGQASVQVTVNLAWWVIALEVVAVVVLAVISAVVGGALGWVAAAVAAAVGAAVSVSVAVVVGAAIGAVIGIVVGIVIAVAINSAINNSVSASLDAAAGAISGELADLNVIPPELQAVFGRLEAAAVHFDDVQVFGRAVIPPPANERPLLAPAEIVLERGQGLDLDRGIVVAATDPGCDIDWVFPLVKHPGMKLVRALGATWASAMVPVTGVSYAALRLASVRALPFPATGGSSPASAVPLDVQEPVHPLVFGVRTGEGRFAKCAAWRDSSRRLHVRYTLWDTPARLRIVPSWSSQRGNVVASASVLATTWEVARTGTFRAVPVTLHEPVAYRWLWNGQELHDGDSGLAGGVDSVSISGDTCVLRTAYGQAIDGVLCVDATDSFGVRADVCRQVSASGTETEISRPDLDRFRESNWLAELLARRGGEDPDWGSLIERQLFGTLPEVAHVREFAPLAEQLHEQLQLAAGSKVGPR